MRAIVDAETFSEALNNVSKLLPKSTVPILECVLIRLEKGCCTLTASDLSTCLTLELPAQGDDFSFALQKPLTAVKACRYFKGELALELPENDPKYPEVVFACGQRSGRFDAYPAEEYPELPKQEELVSFTANAADLLKRIERVKYAVREPQGYSYRVDQTCVQFRGNDVFCLDGYRAACDTDPALTFPRPFMTWGKSLACLKLMGSGDVTVRMGTNHIWLASDAVTICYSNEGYLPADGRRSKTLSGRVLCFPQRFPAGAGLSGRFSAPKQIPGAVLRREDGIEGCHGPLFYLGGD